MNEKWIRLIIIFSNIIIAAMFIWGVFLTYLYTYNHQIGTAIAMGIVMLIGIFFTFYPIKKSS